MGKAVALIFLIVLVILSTVMAKKIYRYQYCVVGSGPAGLQMAYFLQKAKRNYIVFERENISGSFFKRYPRHRRLLSVNKKHTGVKNTEFNLRHDWNSLLSDNNSLIMTRYSDEYYPDADDLVRYLNDYATHLKLKIQYNTDIIKISRVHYKDSVKFRMVNQHSVSCVCDTAIISTGLSVPYYPKGVVGMDLAEGYESMSTNTSEYQGQTILILGQGNSAFETAQALSSASNFIHVHGRGGVRLATSTHYIGDVRAINSKVIDSYQLKTLDGLNEQDVRFAGFFKDENNTIKHCTKENNKYEDDARNKGYHRVIRCLGFKYDNSIFSKSAKPKSGRERLYKYPEIDPDYSSVNVPNLYFAGAIAHSLDYRHSGGCCIQGFRYTVRALHRILEWRNYQKPWPAISLKSASLIDHLLTRINQASGLYQMFGKLADVIIIGRNHRHEYLEEVPVGTIPSLSAITDRSVGKGFITLTFEYGKNFSERGQDTLGQENYKHTVETAHRSRNIHPILRYYDKPIKALTKNEFLPKGIKQHHVLEDFLTDWSVYSKHGYYVKLFIQSVLRADLSSFYVNSCFEFAMTLKTLPESCNRALIQNLPLMS